MAHQNIDQRRAYVWGLLDQGGQPSTQTIHQIAQQFRCWPGAIYRDIAMHDDPLTWNGYRDMDAVATQNARARRLGVVGKFSLKEWRALRERYNNCCAVCGEAQPLGPDHVIPLSRGGTNTIDNIQPLCLSCNTKKGSKTDRVAVYIDPESAALAQRLLLRAWPGVATVGDLLGYAVRALAETTTD